MLIFLLDDDHRCRRARPAACPLARSPPAALSPLILVEPYKPVCFGLCRSRHQFPGVVFNGTARPRMFSMPTSATLDFGPVNKIGVDLVVSVNFFFYRDV